MTASEFFDHAAPYISLIAIICNAWLLWNMTESKRDRDSIKSDLSSFRLTVAKEYVAQTSLRELEERLVATIERLGDRLDRVLDRAGK